MLGKGDAPPVLKPAIQATVATGLTVAAVNLIYFAFLWSISAPNFLFTPDLNVWEMAILWGVAWFAGKTRSWIVPFAVGFVLIPVPAGSLAWSGTTIGGQFAKMAWQVRSNLWIASLLILF